MNFILTASFEGSLNRQQGLNYQKFFKETFFHTIVRYVLRSPFQQLALKVHQARLELSENRAIFEDVKTENKT